MGSEALSCILNSKNFPVEAPITPSTRGGLTPSRTPPPSRLRRSASCLRHEQFSQLKRYRYFSNLVDKTLLYLNNTGDFLPFSRGPEFRSHSQLKIATFFPQFHVCFFPIQKSFKKTVIIIYFFFTYVKQ